ncbi:transketolase [Cupriavidus sp. USMAA2-4]|uniref:Transketolase n=1 Tax=Cupriavidus malaysiensis TaxID=367825 RepID=A0ABN4TNZ2_9BURK|nr:MULTISPECIES: transketolase [Cupriavidus]AOY93018.1 transketolase [Cupriavidus sp. USMAA2-4]AOZ07325.1 transketolase [Cupriavidus malaysiensis]
MRKQLCDALVARAAAEDSNMVFLTGDLGFMALEPLQTVMGERFINAGVAEQNMISVAAALARQGLDAWAYSIAPFCYARPFEQIRNDICFHNLPVRLIGNGGGYGYGVMGPTHHAIEDYGILLTLPNMMAFTPVFDEDIPAVVARAGGSSLSAYLRLGRGEAPKGYTAPPYAPWRQLVAGVGTPVVAVGPLAGTYIEALAAQPENVRPALWAVSELPLSQNPVPRELMDQIERTGTLCVAEEHVARGSLASELALYLMKEGVAARVTHLCAKSHHYARYGSQTYLRKASGLDTSHLLSALNLA